MVDENEQVYVFTKDAVLRSIDRLLSQYIHEHFTGYLAILRAGAANSGIPIRVPDIREFLDRYLHVVGAPEKLPYVRPFKSRGQGVKLFNPNVSGSYSPSSIREGRPLADVVEAVGTGRDASLRLKNNHGDVAFRKLLRGQKVPAGALACFLYRDYGFHLDKPDVSAVISLFREEFAMSDTATETDSLFKTLFDDDSTTFTSADLVELTAESSDHAQHNQ